MATINPVANRNTIASEWKRLGWSDVAIAGMLGRMSRESSFNTGIVNPGDASDGTDSFGGFQWNRGRLRNLKAFAKKEGTKPSDPKTQARFTHWEITQGPEKATWKRLQNAKTVQQAVDAAMLYTRPEGTIKSGKLSPRTGLHYKETLANAKKFYGSKVEPAKTPLDEMQSMWDPKAISKNQSDWKQDGPAPQNDAVIDFAATAEVEEGIINANETLAEGAKETPNEGSFNPDLAGSLAGLLNPLNNQKSDPAPAPPSINELASLFRPRLSWASL